MYRWRIAFAMVVAALLTQTAPAAALDPAPFSPAPPGTELTWKVPHTGRTFTHVVQLPHGFAWRYLRSDGQQGEWVPFCHYCKRVDVYDETAYAKLWPLDVGKKVTFRREHFGTGREWENVIEVTGTDTVTLPFGTFEVYVIEATSRRIGGPWNDRGTYLYAPQLGWYVSVRYYDSDGERIDVDLIEYR